VDNLFVVYYKVMKRDECRCDERLKAKAEDLHASHKLYTTVYTTVGRKLFKKKNPRGVPVLFFFFLHLRSAEPYSLRRRQAVWFRERKSAGEERSKCKMRGDETRSIAPL
jgi:hypothetical protein